MGLRFRQSIKVAPGVRVNVGAKSVGVSVGVPGFHVGCNSRTGAYVSLGIPGTGLSYRQNLGAPQRPQQSRVWAQGDNHLIFPGSERYGDYNAVAVRAWNTIQACGETAATSDLEHLHCLCPWFACVWYYLARALQDNAPWRGKTLIEQFIHQCPDLPHAWVTLARCYESLEDYESAAQAAEKAASLCPFGSMRDAALDAATQWRQTRDSNEEEQGFSKEEQCFQCLAPFRILSSDDM